MINLKYHLDWYEIHSGNVSRKNILDLGFLD